MVCTLHLIEAIEPDFDKNFASEAYKLECELLKEREKNNGK
jgi:hypothetical protein